MPSTEQAAPDYFTLRGLAPTTPATLNAALRQVLDSMPTMLYGEPSKELTDAEREVLVEGGVRLNVEPEGDDGPVRRARQHQPHHEGSGVALGHGGEPRPADDRPAHAV